ncbi:MAG: oxidoreductase [Candidatus Schekmanbacteria bacterium]|nr:oxidoreductase [Candidatus Schekmanbacteria bacterium]
MQTEYSPILIFIFLLPFLGLAFYPVLVKRSIIWAAYVSAFICALCFLMITPLIPQVLRGKLIVSSTIYFSPQNTFNPQMVFSLRADAFGVYFAWVSALVWLLAAVFSCEYLKQTAHPLRYFCLFSACLSFVFGIAFAGNLFTLFIFYELLTISGYPLIAHEETSQAKAAAKKYIIYSLLGDALVLFTVLLVYYMAGNLELHRRGTIPAQTGVESLRLLLVCGLLGFGVKSAIMPLHGWIYEAHPAAPAPASAVLSGVFVNVGAYGLIRLIYDVIGFRLMRQGALGMIVVFPALVTILLTSIQAYNQDNLKRRLAYSTSAQISYILLGAALLSPNSLQGGIIHMAYHAIMKATLFLCAGAIVKAGGSEDVSRMNGLGAKMPLIMIAFSIAGLSLVGIPPTTGFISKWMLATGALEVSDTGSVVILLLGSLLSALYILPVIYAAFLKKDTDQTADISETNYQPAALTVPLIIGAALSVLMGIFVNLPGFPFSFARVISASFLGR